MTGEAFTFVTPQDESDLRAIERAIGRTLPRVTLPDFNYQARAAKPLEIPHAQRIAEIRARKADERARARKNAERRGAAAPARSPHAPSSGARPPRPGGSAPPRGGHFQPRGRRRP
jgi:ATP-dependent RNA helicase RhlE